MCQRFLVFVLVLTVVLLAAPAQAADVQQYGGPIAETMVGTVGNAWIIISCLPLAVGVDDDPPYVFVGLSEAC